MRRLRVAGVWGLLLLYLGLIFWASHQPSLNGFLPVWDKLVHALEYAVLAALAVVAFHGRQPGLSLRATLAAVAFTILYGIGDEIHQAFVPGRDASVFDLLADAVGALAGTAAIALSLRRFRSDRVRRRGPEDAGSVL